MGKAPKIAKLLLICISSIIFITFIIFIFDKTNPPKQVKFGVTFSPRYARYLNLDWQKTYVQILDELKVENLRIPSYWDIIEPEPQKYDFSETDFMLSKAQDKGAKVILVLGIRQPRWPECYVPSWAKNLDLRMRQKKALDFIQKIVERYQQTAAIVAWQVENEPFAFWFGENCDPPNSEFLKKEVTLVKKLDPGRPIIITDSGELSLWIDSISSADILGISIYRKSFNAALNLYLNYPLTPSMYRLKAYLISQWFNRPIIVSELQAEPWLSDKDSQVMSPVRQNQLFTLENFKDNIIYAKKTGFEEDYLWGVEWWYWMAKNGYPQYLDFAKSLF